MTVTVAQILGVLFVVATLGFIFRNLLKALLLSNFWKYLVAGFLTGLGIFVENLFNFKIYKSWDERRGTGDMWCTYDGPDLRYDLGAILGAFTALVLLIVMILAIIAAGFIIADQGQMLSELLKQGQAQ